jgi:hypothetical protein
MTLRDVFRNGLPVRAVLVLWLASSVVVLFLLKRIEWTLIYGLFETNYGLQYNVGWGVPYAAYMYTIYFFVAVPMALSGAVLILDFWTGRKHAPLQESKSKDATPETSKENMLISCPNCKKVFSRPLAMLDFNGKSPKLVNVCPYCNSMLKEEKAKQDEDTNTGVLKPEQEEKTTPQNDSF